MYVVRGIFGPTAPTSQPTNQPSQQPSKQPTAQPSLQPTMQPTQQVRDTLFFIYTMFVVITYFICSYYFLLYVEAYSATHCTTERSAYHATFHATQQVYSLPPSSLPSPCFLLTTPSTHFAYCLDSLPSFCIL